MLDRPDVKRIELDRVSRLPWVAPPAGYIILIQDVAYGSRYKIARHQQLDKHLIRRGADFPFETRVARVWQADDAAAAERDLHDEIAAGTTIGEWFDLYQFQTPSSAPARPYESVSLRDLAQHSGDAESLLQDAKIVGVGGPAATIQAPADSPSSMPQTPAPGIQRAARTRGPRRLRWAFVLGMFILAGFFAAERSSEFRRAMDSILDISYRPVISNRAAAPTTVASRSGTGSALPTPKVEGRGEVFYAKSRANARACARLSCKVLTVLSPNAQFVAQRYVEGQRVNGSDRWIVFRFRGQDANIHSSVVSKVRRISEPLPEQSPTARPTRVPATVEGQDEVFYVAADIQARVCARWSCASAGMLPLGARITALNYTRGQWINGIDRWIRFYKDGRAVYLHRGHLTRVKPRFVANPTAKAPDLQSADSASGETYYLKTRARARLCTRLDCEVADVFEIGAPILAAGYLRGERINNNSRWISFVHDGRNLYLHSDLLSKQRPPDGVGPQPTATTIRVSAKPTAEGENEIFYVRSEARARTCPRLTCSEAQLLWLGMRIIALRYTQGEAIDGSDRWIRFINRGWIQYVHSSFLSRDMPMADLSAEASATVPPSPAPEYDEDELFYVKPGVIADIRTCMRLACHRVAGLKSGAEILPILVVNGQSINGNAKWVMFDMGSHRRFAHTGDLTQIKPSPEATAEPSPISQTASIQTVKYEKNQYYYVRSRVKASVRSCANPNCDEVGVLLPGMHVWAVEVVRGPAVSGSSEWIQFDYRGRHRYIHSRFLSPQHASVNADGDPSRPAQSTATDPPATATDPPPTVTDPPPTATEPPPTATVAPAANYVVETAGNVNANVRSCPRTSCEIVAKYGPGTEVEALGSVSGETVYETDIWLEIRLDVGSAFIHSELVAETQ